MSNRGETMAQDVDAAFQAFDADPSLENERELRALLLASGWRVEDIDRAVGRPEPEETA